MSQVKSTTKGTNKANLANLIARAGGREEFDRRRAEMAARYPDEDGPDQYAIAWQRSGALRLGTRDADDAQFTRPARVAACPPGSAGRCLRCGAAFARTAQLSHTCPKCREHQVSTQEGHDVEDEMVYQEAAC